MKTKFYNYIFLAISFLLLISCNETINDTQLVNQPPETHLFLYPDSTLSQQKSKLQVHWWGDDRDGLVIGFLIKWDGIDKNWSFTTSNDSVFALPIGTVDTSFSFLVASVDNDGNGKHDNSVFVDGIDIGAEPYSDLNQNKAFDNGEPFIDFGLIDRSPAMQRFPIKNSSPEVSWNDLSVLPEKSFPTITVGWDAFDLDGDETINEIHLALNDTSEYVVLPGSTRLVSLIAENLKSNLGEMNIFINADKNKLFDMKLTNLLFDDFNRLYIRGVDNSGARSEFSSLPDTGRTWYVAKPKGELLIIDDFKGGEQVTEFYRERFDLFANSNYNELNLEKTTLPYESITFKNTLSLFKYIYWYSSSNPRLDLTSLITQGFLQNGGKIVYSMTFQDSSANFEFSAQGIQSFLPIEKFDEKKPLSFMFPGANIISTGSFDNFPTLKTETTIGFVRTFKVSSITSTSVYDLTSSQINGDIAFMDNTKSLFFIGLPLHQCDGNENIGVLLQKVFQNEFGMN